MNNANRKRGRPCVPGSMHNQYRLMMTDDMTARLGELSRLTGKSKANIFREAFNMYENLERSRLPDVEYDDFYDDFEDEEL